MNPATIQVPHLAGIEVRYSLAQNYEKQPSLQAV